MTELGEVNGIQTISFLNDQSTYHAFTRHDIFHQNDDSGSTPLPLVPTPESFTLDRYSSAEFHGIIPDTGAAEISSAGYEQVLALQKSKPDIHIDTSSAGANQIKFGKGTAIVIGIVKVPTPLGHIDFHVVHTNTPFLLCLEDMDTLRVKFDNLRNVLIQGSKIVPIIRKWGHPWMLLDDELTLEKTIAGGHHLTEPELRQLHRRFGHPSIQRLADVLRRAGHDDVNKDVLAKLTKSCHQCQMHGKSPGRFKFTLKDDCEFNYSIVIDILYLNGRPVLQVVDSATGFNAARFVKDMSANSAWNTLRVCWIDSYLGPPDRIVHDAGKNFASAEFRHLAKSMAIEVKEVPVESHHSIGLVERYHAPLRRAYEILEDELNNEQIDKDMILQMAVKAVNDSAGPNGLVPTLLVFGAYPRLTEMDPPSPSVVRRAEAIRAAMKEVRQIHAKRKVQDALAMRNGPDTSATLDLPLQSDVRVWREKNGWQGPYKLLATSGETCTIDMPHGPANFRSTVVKPYFTDGDQTPNPAGKSTPEAAAPDEAAPDEATPDEAAPDQITSETAPVRRGPARSRKLPTRYTNVADEIFADEIFMTDEVFITRKEQADQDLSLQLRQKGVITTLGKPFEASDRQEIDGLVTKGVFEFVPYNPVEHAGVRIFNSRLVHEIKGKTTVPYEKSRLVIQAYNDEGKEMILTQSPTIQRASQRLIMALAPSLLKSPQKIRLFLRDITQAYVQSTTPVNRLILANLPKEMRDHYPPDTVMIVQKPLYGLPEAGTHWWATYYKHHQDKLHMTTSSYDPCLLITTSKDTFGVVGMQTDDTLFLGSEQFAALEEEELVKAKLTAKPRDELTSESPLIFNGCVLEMIPETDTMVLLQKDQGKKLQLVTTAEEYLEQRARGGYIASICQPEASFDLSIAAQHQNPDDNDVQELNKRLQWQLANLDRGIKYIPIDLNNMKLFVFVDGSFANNKDYSSQIGFIIILANESTTIPGNVFQISGNLIHYSSTKCKRVTRSVLASEIYGMVAGMDIAIAIGTTLRMITEQLDLPSIPMVMCTDSYSLYECLVKLGTTKEKRLMIDIMALRQSYERREITEIRWIDGKDNPADAMTKSMPNKALERFMDSNQLQVRMEGWVERNDLKE